MSKMMNPGIFTNETEEAITTPAIQWMNTSLNNISSENESVAHQVSGQSEVVPGPFIPYIAWLILMACVGTVGNFLIIFAVIFDKELQTISNIFVVNLAFADVFVTTIIDPFAVVGVFNNGAFFYDHPSLCIGLGAFVVTCCGCSIWTIVTISIDRYIHICHPALYPKVFNRRTAPFILVTVWIIAVAIALPYFEVFGWGIYGYFPKGRICTCIFNVSYYYALYLIGLELALPMVIIPYCYVRIYLVVRKSKRRLQKHGRVFSNSEGKWKDSEIRILKMVATIWAVFMTMWAPYTTNVLFDVDASWPDWFFITAVAFCLSNSSINFIIYGVMNANFRHGYVMIFKTMMSCKRAKDNSSRPEHGDASRGRSTNGPMADAPTLLTAQTLGTSTNMLTADVYIGQSSYTNQALDNSVTCSNI